MYVCVGDQVLSILQRDKLLYELLHYLLCFHDKIYLKNLCLKRAESFQGF